MVRLTAEVIKRKAEHNDGTLGDLEEVALHQLEIERIEAVGTLCRRLRILYLQNNIISKLENLQHLKELEYLNVALNNITMIEGLESCEFLKKLDLTVNFIPLRNLEQSARNLKPLRNLREIYVVGNPFSDWEGHKDYLTAELPWLDKIDGTRIQKSDRIRAAQRFDALRAELARLAADEVAELDMQGGAGKATAKSKSKGKVKIEEVDEQGNVVESLAEDEEGEERGGQEEGGEGGDEGDAAPYTPELRTAMYREMAEEKAEKERRDKERQPRERNANAEHAKAVEEARAKAFFPDGRVRQCNEGGLPFAFDEDAGHFFLTVGIPRFADTSLVDCEVFPRYVQVVFKDKTLRVALPGGDSEEVRAHAAKCERSKTTGELKVTMPKVEPSALLTVGGAGRENDANTENSAPSDRVKRLDKRASRAEQLLAAAAQGPALHAPVDVKTIYQGAENPNLEARASLLTLVQQQPAAVAAQGKLEQALGVPPLEDDE